VSTVVKLPLKKILPPLENVFDIVLKKWALFRKLFPPWCPRLVMGLYSTVTTNHSPLCSTGLIDSLMPSV